MTTLLDRLFSDPDQYFFSFDGDHLRFIEMDREHYRRSIFLDRRIDPAQARQIRVPLEPLLTAHAKRGFSEPSVGWLLHIAHCGSTLLARALDLPGRSLVLREPTPLRQLGVYAGAANDPALLPPAWRAQLGFAVEMLARTYSPGEAIVVKANVPVNFIADEFFNMSPGAAGLLLHMPLAPWLAAVLRSEGHRGWVENIGKEVRLEAIYGEGALDGASIAVLGAALWLAQLRMFNTLLDRYSQLRSLDAGLLFDRPAFVLAEAAALFGIALDADEAAAISDGPLFHHYSKSDAVAFDAAERAEREAADMERLSGEISEAHAWVEARQDKALPERLPNPLIGENRMLLG